MSFTFCVPTLFGLEGLVGEECRRLGFQQVQVENGRVFFQGNESQLAAANLCLRCGERVLLQVGKFSAETFDDLFEETRALPWEELLPRDAAFPVKGHSLDSRLHSVPDCQKMIKKAVVERLKTRYHQDWFQETGVRHQIQFALRKDVCELFLDTTGAGLHKRGYRPAGNAAPLRETLAAALVLLARYRGKEVFRDPMCGSGTILIEAALIAANRAPGLHRHFDAMRWPIIGDRVFHQEEEHARSREFYGEYSLLGGDVDPESITLARENIRRAEVESMVHVRQEDAGKLSVRGSTGVLITNPPYGQRLGDLREAETALRLLGAFQRDHQSWTVGVLSPHESFERVFGRSADRRRKLYNGMIRCGYYLYLPVKRGNENLNQESYIKTCKTEENKRKREHDG